MNENPRKPLQFGLGTLLWAAPLLAFVVAAIYTAVRLGTLVVILVALIALPIVAADFLPDVLVWLGKRIVRDPKKPEP